MVPDAACTHATSSAKSPYDAVKMISGVYQIWAANWNLQETFQSENYYRER